MKTKKSHYRFSMLVTIILLTITKSYALNYSIGFTATGLTNSVGNVHVQNLTKGTSVTVPNGNTLTLTDLSTAIDINKSIDVGIHISQNSNNGKYTLTFNVENAGNTQVSVFGIDGKKILFKANDLQAGNNSFTLTLPIGIYIVQINGNGYTYSKKIQSMTNANSNVDIKLNIKNDENGQMKIKNAPISSTTIMTYTNGDQLLYTATSGDYVASVPDIPTGSKNINFNFSKTPTSFIPSGTFMMGSPWSETGGSFELQYSVTLSAFRISKYEITNAQYATFLNAKGIGSDGKYALGSYPNEKLIDLSSSSWCLKFVANQWVSNTGYENHPVVNVSWYGAKEYATYIGGFLPTEAQWEYACRAGTTTPFNTGSCLTNLQAKYDWSQQYTNCSTNSTTTSPLTTVAVGSYQSNTWGLYDMHGNVTEWCADWYDYYPTSAQTNPTGASNASFRVIRGGGLASQARECRSAHRQNGSPNAIDGGLGFRVAFIP